MYNIFDICKKFLMKEFDLKKRTKSFTISILNLVDNLPSKHSARIIANQLGKSGSSLEQIIGLH